MSRDIIPFGLRMQADLKSQIEKAAGAAKRSMNSEVVTRLHASFHPSFSALPEMVQIAVDEVVESKGCTPTEALTELVLAGQSHGRRVLNLRIGPGTTTQQVRDALNVALELAPDADLVFEREPKA